MRKPRLATGKELIKRWKLPVKKAYFHQESHFYEIPKVFPAALCDMNGFVIFDTMNDLAKMPGVSVTTKVNVTTGIFVLRGYRKAENPIK